MQKRLLCGFGLLVLIIFFISIYNTQAISSEHSSTSLVEGTHVVGSHENFEELHRKNLLGRTLPLWSMFPFIGILLSIALMPFFARQFWHDHFGKISAFWALLFMVPFLFKYENLALFEILHIYIVDYIPFIILIGSLFTVAGGIVIRGNCKGTPFVNSIFLLIGTVLASWIGTTGASMIMIRPILRANNYRKYKKHVIIFFIFLVSNVGGALTPLGDPPLFLGFLHGVPFFWTMGLFPPMLFVVTLLFAFFYLLDKWLLKKERLPRRTHHKITIKIEGTINFLFIGGIVAAILISMFWDAPKFVFFGIHIGVQNIIRDFILILMAVFSLAFTKKKFRDINNFSWAPIIEVAYLFAGIFITIIPALAVLKASSQGSMHFLLSWVKEPWHYFWVTGLFSSFLDNAPTYLAFLNTQLGQLFSGIREDKAIELLIQRHEVFLMAVSCGAVFMGAMTYIGNAPNLMVKSIARRAGVVMPSFFGYILWSVGILGPIFILMSLVFFS